LVVLKRPSFQLLLASDPRGIVLDVFVPQIPPAKVLPEVWQQWSQPRAERMAAAYSRHFGFEKGISFRAGQNLNDPTYFYGTDYYVAVPHLLLILLCLFPSLWLLIHRLKNQFIVMAVAVGMLTAGGAARAAEKEAPIDWPARAATVKVGMTRAEVEKILPRWNPPGYQVHGVDTDTKTTLEMRDGKRVMVMQKPLKGTGDALSFDDGFPRSEWYLVAEDWRVEVVYDYTGGGMPVRGPNGEVAIRYSVYAQNRLLRPVKIEKIEKPVPPKPTP